ncbi:MAG TPA: helix-turn-helix transcriptional regulator, partial [Thermoanaerobaculia bacterium]|nr:helix-turn-helix transcriptional regulator [Thermoanaerobaculia bacterium]
RLQPFESPRVYIGGRYIVHGLNPDFRRPTPPPPMSTKVPTPAPTPTQIEPFLPLRPAPLHVLLAIDAGESHGYAIMRHAEYASGGAVRLGPGTLYGALQRLLAQGLLAEAPGSDDDDPRRRPYRLTPLGRAVLGAEVERLERVVAAARSQRALAGRGGSR